MLTIFSTPKPFCGHIAVIQRNAISSWSRLHPDAEIILFGKEEGAAEAARDLGIRHEPDVRTNATGTKILSDIFARAQQLARHDLLCYVNCDIILTSDFRRAVQTIAAGQKKFLMVGRRWDMDIATALPFDRSGWDDHLASEARRLGHQRPAQWIDYFVFPRGLYTHIPDFVIGRVGWDNWLVWKAGALRVPVVDASAMVTAVHQNHDYSYHPDGEAGVWHGEEARRNIEIAGGWSHLHTIRNASHQLTARGIRRRRFHRLIPARDAALRVIHSAASSLLHVTRPARHSLRLRKDILQRLRTREAAKETPHKGGSTGDADPSAAEHNV